MYFPGMEGSEVDLQSPYTSPLLHTILQDTVGINRELSVPMVAFVLEKLHCYLTAEDAPVERDGPSDIYLHYLQDAQGVRGKSFANHASQDRTWFKFWKETDVVRRRGREHVLYGQSKP